MKTIGLIGGMGWQSSMQYYQLINIKVNEIFGESHSAKIVMTSVDFAEIEKLTFKENWGGIGEIMKHHAQLLERAGVDIILLCTNLIHLVSNSITDNISVPFLHIANATGAAIHEKGVNKVLLLGTKYTMEKDFYKHTLESEYGLEIHTPNEKDRQTIHDIIYQELLKGVFPQSSRNTIIEIIERKQHQGVEGAILGCTELPILIRPKDVTIPTFDTGEIHAQKAVDIATKNDIMTINNY